MMTHDESSSDLSNRASHIESDGSSMLKIIFNYLEFRVELMLHQILS